MSSNQRNGAAPARSGLAPGSLLALAFLVGGCSADVTRFDFPAFGIADKGGETGSLPTPAETIARRPPSYDYAPSGPPRGAGLSEADRGYAPPPAPPAYAPPPYATGSSGGSG